MIAAEALGIPLECVRLASGDTDMGVDLGAYSSRQTLMTGHAAKEAAEDVKRQVLEVLADELNLPVEAMDIKNGAIVFDRDDVDFSALRTRYIKEHRGWTDNPDRQAADLQGSLAHRLSGQRHHRRHRANTSPQSWAANSRGPPWAPPRPTAAAPRWSRSTWTWKPAR